MSVTKVDHHLPCSVKIRVQMSSLSGLWETSTLERVAVEVRPF